jgi:hypothetical protein
MGGYQGNRFGRFATRIVVALATIFCALIASDEVAAADGDMPSVVNSIANRGNLEKSYNASTMLNGPVGPAAQFAIPMRLDTIVRDYSEAHPSPLQLWLNGDYGQDKGNYLEGGISASFVLGKNARYPLILTIPANAAVGDAEYCFGPSFGYVTTGINVRMPVSFIPSRYGKWMAASSADLCYYGTSAGEFVRSIGLHIPKIGAALSVDF